MAGWCPQCRCEWWSDAEVCADCGVELQAHEPPAPPTLLEDLRAAPGPEHEQGRFDWGPLDASDRWRIELALTDAGIAYEWEEGDEPGHPRLLAPVSAQPFLESIELPELPDDEAEVRHRPGPQVELKDKVLGALVDHIPTFVLRPRRW